MDYTIYTIGGGEFLINIFKGLSALSGHKAYLSMAKVAILFGLLWILFEVTFSGMFKRGIQWFFTIFLMFNILFVPKVTVIIEDKLNPNISGRNIIQGVPFALGVVGHFTSIMGNKATELMETAFGGNNNLPYNKYGMIAPINVADSITRAKITNTDFAKTMRHFMWALGKVDKLQLVKIQSTQSIANSVEPNFTYREVTNYAKLKGGMYWVVTQVKDVSSEIANIVEVDMLHFMEERIYSCDKASNYCSTGVSDHDTIQDGIYLNLGDPLHSYESEYLKTSYQKQGLRDSAMEVGLTHSTLSMGKPYTWGRGQQYSVSLSTLNSQIHGG